MSITKKRDLRSEPEHVQLLATLRVGLGIAEVQLYDGQVDEAHQLISELSDAADRWFEGKDWRA